MARFVAVKFQRPLMVKTSTIKIPAVRINIPYINVVTATVKSSLILNSRGMKINPKIIWGTVSSRTTIKLMPSILSKGKC